MEKDLIREDNFRKELPVVCGFCQGTKVLFNAQCPYCEGEGIIIRVTEGTVKLYKKPKS